MRLIWRIVIIFELKVGGRGCIPGGNCILKCAKRQFCSMFEHVCFFSVTVSAKAVYAVISYLGAIVFQKNTGIVI